MPKRAIDLNCDLGESFGCYKLGHDEAVIPLISSANVACGFHAGDPHVMRRTVALANAAGVRIGAHPGLPDLLGFGRRRMAVTTEEVEDYYRYQIGALRAFVEATGQRLQHVKMHGALYEMALSDPSFTRAMCAATGDLIWLTPVGPTATIARECGLKVVEDFYADRAYNSSRSLVSRKIPGAVLHDLLQIRRQVVQALETGTVTTLEGEQVTLEFSSICVHGDTPEALDIVRLIREICAERNIAIQPLSELFA